jgi:hypothetical protein
VALWPAPKAPNNVAGSENIDTATPTGKLMFHMLAALAEFERDVISAPMRGTSIFSISSTVVLPGLPSQTAYAHKTVVR